MVLTRAQEARQTQQAQQAQPPQPPQQAQPQPPQSPQPPLPPQPPPPAPPKPKKKPAPKRPAPKETAASTSGVKKPPTKGKVPRAGKKKLAAEKKKKKKKGNQNEDDDEVVSDSDDQPAEPTGGDGNGDEEPAPAPAPPTGGPKHGEEGQPMQPSATDAGYQKAGAATIQRQPKPNASRAQPSVVIHEDWPVPDEIIYDRPGYDGARATLEYHTGLNRDYLTPAALNTAPEEFQYRNMRWTREATVGAGSFGKAE